MTCPRVITKLELEEIYKKALVMCRIKCFNASRRDAISQYKYFLEKKELEFAESLKERIRKSYYGFECYECRCTPDKSFMLKLLNELIKKANKEEL